MKTGSEAFAEVQSSIEQVMLQLIEKKSAVSCSDKPLKPWIAVSHVYVYCVIAHHDPL